MTMQNLHRRALLAGALAAASAGPALARKPAPTAITVYKTPWCGCCGGWVTHLQANGFAPKVVELEDLAPIRARHGVADALASCHTGVVAGYAIEGHVPAADIRKLLREKPKARGISVPGMPIGSPGMEAPDGHRQPYETLLILPKGATRVFARHS
jgi:hypothetical protein